MLFTSNSNNVQLVCAEDRFSVCSKMFPEIQLDSKTTSETCSLNAFAFVDFKTAALEIGSSANHEKTVSEILSTTDQQRKEDQGRIEKPHEEMLNQTRIKKHNKFLALHSYSHTGKMEHGNSAVRYPCSGFRWEIESILFGRKRQQNIFCRFFANGLMLQSAKMTQFSPRQSEKAH